MMSKQKNIEQTKEMKNGPSIGGPAVHVDWGGRRPTIRRRVASDSHRNVRV
jgi:hypothetical protein